MHAQLRIPRSPPLFSGAIAVSDCSKIGEYFLLTEGVGGISLQHDDDLYKCTISQPSRIIRDTPGILDFACKIPDYGSPVPKYFFTTYIIYVREAEVCEVGQPELEWRTQELPVISLLLHQQRPNCHRPSFVNAGYYGQSATFPSFCFVLCAFFFTKRVLLV